MKKYDFLIDGILVSVYPHWEMDISRYEIADCLSDGRFAVMLYPDSFADYRAVCIDKNNNEPREPHLALAALSCFFFCVRAYPSMTLYIRYFENMFEVCPPVDSRYVFSVNAEKCKILCTKILKYDDGVELTAYEVGKNSSILCFACSDAELFDTEKIYRCLLKDGRASAVAACSYSEDRGLIINSAGDPLFYDVICAASTVLFANGCVLFDGICRAMLDGTEHLFLYSRGRVEFYPEVKYIS